MADAINPNNIPVGRFPLVAGYVDGPRSQWPAAGWARHAGSILVRIAVFASTNAGTVLDVETGDATPAQAPGWVQRRRTAGVDPSVYCSISLWPAVRAAFHAANVAEPHYWVAGYPGGGAVIPAGAIAHQYADPATSGGQWDLSVVADYWPGVDTGGTMDWTDPLANPLYNPAVTDPADTRSHKTYTAEQYLVGSWVRTLNLPATEAQIDADVKAAQAALSGALSTDEAAILAAVQGVDADTKAGVVKLVASIAAVPAGQPPTDAQVQAIEAAIVKALPSYTVNITPTGGTP